MIAATWMIVASVFTYIELGSGTETGFPTFFDEYDLKANGYIPSGKRPKHHRKQPEYSDEKMVYETTTRLNFEEYYPYGKPENRQLQKKKALRTGENDDTNASELEVFPHVKNDVAARTDWMALPERLTLTNKWDEFKKLTAKARENLAPGEGYKISEQDIMLKWAGYSRNLISREKAERARALRQKELNEATKQPKVIQTPGMDPYWGPNNFQDTNDYNQDPLEPQYMRRIYFGYLPHRENSTQNPEYLPKRQEKKPTIKNQQPSSGQSPLPVKSGRRYNEFGEIGPKFHDVEPLEVVPPDDYNSRALAIVHAQLKGPPPPPPPEQGSPSKVIPIGRRGYGNPYRPGGGNWGSRDPIPPYRFSGAMASRGSPAGPDEQKRLDAGGETPGQLGGYWAYKQQRERQAALKQPERPMAPAAPRAPFEDENLKAEQEMIVNAPFVIKQKPRPEAPLDNSGRKQLEKQLNDQLQRYMELERKFDHDKADMNRLNRRRYDSTRKRNVPSVSV